VKVVLSPRLIVVGFARSVIAGAGGGGAGAGGGGGGVGAAATFFLQPNDSSRSSVRTINPTFLMREEVMPSLLVESLLNVPGPRWCCVFSGVCQLSYLRSVEKHRIDLPGSIPRRFESDMPSIRRPCRSFIISRIMGNLRMHISREIVNIDVEVRCPRFQPRECNALPVR